MHLVFDSNATLVHQAVQNMAQTQITGWDHNLDTAAQWAVSGNDETPDIFFINGTVNVGVIETQTGNRMTRHQALLRRFREIRLSRPQSKIVLLLPPDEKQEMQFIRDLIALGIYDFYFLSEFDEDSLKAWLNSTRSIADVKQYLPGEEIQERPFVEEQPSQQTKISYGKEDKNQGRVNAIKSIVDVVGGLKNKLAQTQGKPPRQQRGNKAKDPAEEETTVSAQMFIPAPLITDETPRQMPGFSSPYIAKEETPPEQPVNPAIKEPPVLPEPTQVKTAEKADRGCNAIYALNLNLERDKATCFDAWEPFLQAVAAVKPDAILLSATMPDLENRIKTLRRDKRLTDVPIAVIGPVNESLIFHAGADDHFLSWDEQALMRLKERKVRLTAMWANASSEATRDSLTGIYNRGFLDLYLVEQVELCRKNGTSFSLLMCDIDHFKTINDTYGHQVGDEVLQTFSAYLKSHLRPTDVIARYGGEEFIIVFCNTEKGAAKNIAHQLRQGWQDQRVYNSTFSGGMAEYGLDGNDAVEVIRAADLALYAAKNGGRNAIYAAGEQPKPQAVDFNVKPLKPTQTRVFIVAGADRRVGATSVALALAGILHTKFPTEILDAGGGASRWLRKSPIPVRQGPPFSISPGIVTVVDAGLAIPEEIMPLSEAIFVVTDLSKNALNLRNFQSAKTYLVGNRSASAGGLKEIAELWEMQVLFALPEDKTIREAEQQGTIPASKTWKKQIKRIL
ncbi:MAG: GGDEF domain-containing protein [Bacillota bacterium]